MQNIKELVLIGGGHSHAIALKLFGMKPLPGVRITLITETSHTPYSGMLPGHIAGFYNYNESNINLLTLTQFAQANLFLDRVIGLDLENNKVICANSPAIAFDILSINTGSTPAIISVPGASEYAIPVKPVNNFLSNWNQLLESIDKNLNSLIRIGIVGGGAGGVELAMAMRSRLSLEKHSHPQSKTEIHLFHSDNQLMPTYNPWVRKRVNEILIQRGIKLNLGEKVSEIKPIDGTRVIAIAESGLQVECDRVFWVTQASAPSWIKTSGLSTDSQGFIQVNNTLQSLSHPHIFAAGDIATIVDYPRPKSGVFAVRQGKPLFQNLQRYLLEKPLKPYIPQKQYLSLIGTGDGSAIASWGIFGWESPLFWKWKNYIDRQFMSSLTI